MQQREQVHTTEEGDLSITGRLYIGRQVGDLTITDVTEGLTGREVFFNDGTTRRFRYTRRVNT
jgi:hypothetical protein